MKGRDALPLVLRAAAGRDDGGDGAYLQHAHRHSGGRRVNDAVFMSAAKARQGDARRASGFGRNASVGWICLQITSVCLEHALLARIESTNPTNFINGID